MGSSRIHFAVMLLCSVAGCADAAAPEDGVERITLGAEIGRGDGLVLATGAIVEVVSDPGESDVWLRIGMEMSLASGHEDGGFCPREGDFGAVQDIPSDPVDCAWSPVIRLGGAAPDLERYPAPDAYLVRDRAGELRRLFVVEHDIDEDIVGSMTFDLAPP
jgi:hypothetical protein